MTDIPTSTKYLKADTVEYIALDPGKGVLLDARKGLYFELNATGGSVWNALSEPRSIDQLAEALSAEFGHVPPDELNVFVDTLVDRGLAAVSSPGARNPCST